MRLVHVEGIIGAGKTSVLRELRSQGHTVVFEDLPAWRDCNGINMLERFYVQPQAYGRLFQQLTLHTMVEGVARNAHADVLFVERSLQSNRIFYDQMAPLMPSADAGVYEAAWRAAEACMAALASERVHVLLDAGVDTCLHRVRDRGGSDGEDNVTGGYMSALQAAHRRQFDVVVSTEQGDVRAAARAVLAAVGL